MARPVKDWSLEQVRIAEGNGSKKELPKGVSKSFFKYLKSYV